MKGIIKFSVQKAITVFMVVVAVAVFGVVSFTRLTTDLFPSVNIPYAIVITTYPGASPEEVEQRISIPLENVFQTTTNVQEVTTISQENVSLVTLEFTATANMDSALIEMRENLNQMMDNLPDNAGYPMILRLNPDMLPVMNFSVTRDDMNLAELTTWVENELSPRVERVAGVASLSILGGYQSEIQVMLDDEAINATNDDLNTMYDQIEAFTGEPVDERFLLDKEYIGNILKAQNFSFPAGFIKLDGVDYMVRVGDAIESLDEMRSLTILDLDFGSGMAVNVSLEDIAAVDFANANAQQYSKVNGSDAVSIVIQKGSDFATTDVTEAVNAVLAALEEEEESLTVTMLLDQGEYINQATGSVIQNIILGGILAIIVLFVFLRNFRVTFIVGIAIPVSLLFAIILIYLSGITLNIVSLGGLALGIGMLVDNSIVVMENIFRMKKDGKSNREAAVRGTHQVAGAITASTLTTVGVFLPIMFIEDFVREIFVQLALTISFSLLASLIIALTFVPAVADRILKEDDKTKVKKAKKSWTFEGFKNGYEKVLRAVLKARVFVLIGVLILFVVTLFASVSRGFEFFPATDEGTLNATLEIDPDNPIVFNEFTALLDGLFIDLAEFEDIESVGISLGAGMFNFGMGSDDSSATVSIVLRDDRAISTQAMRDEITTLLEENYNQLNFEVSGTEADIAMLIGSGVSVRIQGADLDQLRVEALAVTRLLEDVEGLRDIDSGFGDEQNEVRIQVDKDLAIEKGLTVAQVLGAVASNLEGPQSITTVRMNGQNYEVFVLEEGQTERLEVEDTTAIENFVVGTNMSTGEPVLLGSIATVNITPGFSTITRINGVRSITVSAALESGVNATLIAEDVQEVLDTHTFATGYDYELLGESEEIMAAVSNLILVGALAILLVYMIMASQFQSMVYPFIIMVTIPLAFTGGFGILYILGMPISIVALIGLIILSGVVVNNGIVLVDYINQLRTRGRSLEEAIVEAGKTRLRPIFMTALTTILALSGLALARGEGAELTQPMALTAIGGLVYATLLTIFVVPIMYYNVTRYGRYIMGSVLMLIVLAAGAYFGLEGEWIYANLLFVSALGVLLGIIFIPKQPLESTEGSSTDKLDEFLKTVVDDDAN